ncbi:hypothetical protein E2K93_07685 [Thalassotalea sp. HSM 43]|uniref:hypothetical protein n=1 Tax=Thalassotalea sp. HSM 43 TaxID=2552945 RepID=UPI0010822F21|nr:hypothetical protein [Thalassotalea sp. HSM 43]QBY04276.1 hypothetical protein E2K93_07685 [Thalassotalea sp. HSM 43]
MFKKILVIIVAAAVYLHFYPNAELTAWYNEQIGSAKQNFSEIADTKARVAPSKILTVLQPEFKKYSKREVAYVESIAASRDDLRLFYDEYCPNLKTNTRLRRAYLQQVCDTVDQYRIL